MTSIGIYNFLLRILGVRSELLDFNSQLTPTNRPVNTFTKQFLKLISIVIGITFAIVYPIETASIISKTPQTSNGKTSLEYFIAFTFFYIKYIVMIIIFVLQFWKEHQILDQQMEIKRIFQCLWEIKKNTLNNNNNCPKNGHNHKNSLRLSSLLNL